MATTATFNSHTFIGRVRERPLGPVEDRHQEHSVTGVIGTTVISGEVAIADVDVILEVGGFSTESDLSTYVRVTIAALKGVVSTLSFSGGATTDYPNCVLKAIHQISWDDQKGPLANKVSTPSTPWTDHVVLKFKQLG